MAATAAADLHQAVIDEHLPVEGTVLYMLKGEMRREFQLETRKNPSSEFFTCSRSEFDLGLFTIRF